MAITPLASSAATTSLAPTANGDITGFAKNFNSFLTLLTQQLKYQDPLSPMDSSQFTTQLVQFTSVEQQIKQNRSLEAMVNLQRSIERTDAVGYIGREIETGGRSLLLQGGEGTASYRLDASAKEVSIAIKNSAGEVVRTLAGGTGAGTNTVAWDGRTDGGQRLGDGTYGFTVSAKDSRGNPVNVTTGFTGVVDGIDVGDETVILRVGAARIPLTDVTAVRAAGAAAATRSLASSVGASATSLLSNLF